MTIRLFFIGLLFLQCSIASFAQSETDSLKVIWENENEPDSTRFRAIGIYYDINSYAQPDSTLVLTDYHYNLAIEKNSSFEKIQAIHEKAVLLFIKGLDEEALTVIHQEIDLAIKLNDPALIARSYLLKGAIHIEKQDYLNALDDYSIALKICQTHNLVHNEIAILNNLAIIHNDIENYDLALEYLEKATALSEESKSGEQMSHIWLNTAGIKYEQGQYNEAILYLKKAIKRFSANNNLFNVSSCYFVMAESYEKLNEIDKAIFYAEKCLAIDREIENEGNTHETLILLANLHFETDVNKATQMGENVLNALNEGSPFYLKSDVYQLLYKCYKAQDKFDLALKMNENYIIYNDSNQLEKSKFAVIRESVKNEFEVKLYESELENEKDQAELKVKQVKRTFTIITIAFITLAFIALYFRFITVKNRKKRKALLRELEQLKISKNSSTIINPATFELNRDKIEESIDRKLNETDWTVLTILLENPVITNKEIAEKAFKSVDGIGSSLRRMYDYFEIKETKYKKIALLTDVTKRSNS